MLIPFIGGVGVCVCVTRQLGLDDNRDMYNIALSFGTPIETCRTKKNTNIKPTVQHLDLLITRSYTVLPGITSSKYMSILYHNRLHCRLDISRQSSGLFDMRAKKQKKEKRNTKLTFRDTNIHIKFPNMMTPLLQRLDNTLIHSLGPDFDSRQIRHDLVMYPVRLNRFGDIEPGEEVD